MRRGPLHTSPLTTTALATVAALSVAAVATEAGSDARTPVAGPASAAGPAARSPRAAATSAGPIPTAHSAVTVATPLTTHGSRIVDAHGRTVVLQGVNWFGFETSNHVVHGLWTRDYRSMLAQIRELGFNTIRLPFSLQAIASREPIQGIDFNGGKNAALRGDTPLEAMDAIIEEAGRQGLFVILDNHSTADNAYQQSLWYGQGYSEDDWVAAWKMLARRYRDQPNVIGADLKNEPHGEATWGDGGPTDWRRAAERAGDAVLSAAPRWLILVEGVGGGAPVPGQQLETHWWGGDLEGVREQPVRLARPRQLVYSPHEYGPGVFPQPWFNRPNTPALLEARWRTGFGFIAQQGIAPILVGEFGGRSVDSTSAEGRWQRQFFDYLSRTGASWTYWSWNPDSGDTGGVLKNDWTTIEGPKTALLQRLISRQRIALRALATPRAHGKVHVPAGRARKGVSSRPGARGHAPGGQAKPPSGPPNSGGQVPPTPPAPSQPAPTQPAPSTPGPPAPGSLHATIVVESTWDGGWCGHLAVSGPDAALGGVHATFTLAAGTRITQSWNADDRTADSGQVTLAFPSWAQLAGGSYSSTGFCVEGDGAAGDITIG